ncbi:hypothetical protein BLNAU_10382 [Blattamonas nauphoetae]|uniref:Transmembrane protein n=1 Tax=Blattamonas nauphoetae TaxID=2049346 RepID=A0ABQ9XTD4_9EUKA|nr:hypothetical protein BLNAU_10382 [Blattamonas nauphoetae]
MRICLVLWFFAFASTRKHKTKRVQSNSATNAEDFQCRTNDDRMESYFDTKIFLIEHEKYTIFYHPCDEFLVGPDSNFLREDHETNLSFTYTEIPYSDTHAIEDCLQRFNLTSADIDEPNSFNLACFTDNGVQAVDHLYGVRFICNKQTESTINTVTKGANYLINWESGAFCREKKYQAWGIVYVVVVVVALVLVCMVE